MVNKEIIDNVGAAQEQFYSGMYKTYKGSTLATSSESLEHKKLRFDCIYESFEKDDNYSIHDVGMGLAQFYEYMCENHSKKQFSYSGTEIVKEYKVASEEKYPELRFYLRNLANEKIAEMYDYVIMSGVFHQIRKTKRKHWEVFLQSILRNSFFGVKKALVFNVVSPFVDFYQENIYYCNLGKLLNFINDDLSRFWNVRQNYPLFEMTITVYNPNYVKELYKQPEFQKYLISL